MSRMTKTLLSYKTIRGLQISTVFSTAIFIQECIPYPHAGWTAFAVMMIYGGFDNATTITRANHRFLGAILGLLTGYLLWFIGHIDYRLLIIIIPMTIFFAYFLARQEYSVPTIFTVNTSLIGTGYFDPNGRFGVTTFLIDYIICTLIAYALVLIFEYFWFSRYDMMKRFIRETQTTVIDHLHQLLYLVNQPKIRRIDWFTQCVSLINSLAEVNRLLANSTFVLDSEQAMGNEFHQFVMLTNALTVNLKALYFSIGTSEHRNHEYFIVSERIQNDINKLYILLTQHDELYIEPGDLRAISN